jgi:uncharacterized protein YbcI
MPKNNLTENAMIERLNVILERNQSYPTCSRKNRNEYCDNNYLYNNQSKLKESDNTTIQKLYKKINEMPKNNLGENLIIQRLNTILERNQSYPTGSKNIRNEYSDYEYLRKNISKFNENDNTAIKKLYKKINEMPKKRKRKSDPTITDNEIIQRLQDILRENQSYPTTAKSRKDYDYLNRNKSKLEESTNKKIQKLYKKIISMKDPTITYTITDNEIIQRLQDILRENQSYPTTAKSRKDYDYLNRNKSKLEESTNKKIQKLYKKIISMKDPTITYTITDNEIIQRLQDILRENQSYPPRRSNYYR